MKVMDDQSKSLSSLVQAGQSSLSQAQVAKLNSTDSGLMFMRKVETYLTEKRNGIPRPYSQVPGALRTKMETSSAFLASTDINTLKSYSGYLTAFSYNKSARFVATSSDSLQGMSDLKRIYKLA